jgi:hypothetical protein
MPNREKFTFAISLSVLNHLGRHLYRSFVTILGEAISNAWDADAINVWIYVDKEKDSFIIKDDGMGMSGADFQNKFLNIGYSKRKDGKSQSPKGRPFIGRKGIGKLALLSCAEKIIIASKIEGGEYVGGVISNPDLDKAITDDLKPEEYPLGELKLNIFGDLTKNHEKGTLICFENVKGGIKNTLGLLKKIVALYFRFALLDDSFNIFIDNDKITYEHLKDLSERTEFLWNINELKDPYIEKLPRLKETKNLKIEGNIQGFIASVGHYRELNIMSLDEKVGIDLFVNGRLRERDILKRISKSRVVESYLYGQIHFNELDDDVVDRFTSSREGIVPDDMKYEEFLKKIEKNVLAIVINDWDKWRREYREDGDSENTSITLRDRKSGELFNVVSKEYILPGDSGNKKKVAGWVNSLADDASFNLGSYAECFVSENLVRKYIHEKSIALSKRSQNEISEWKKREKERKQEGNINIDLRQNNDDLGYLDMSFLASDADKPGLGNPPNSLVTDGKEFKPIRNAVMHTALLTKEAKRKMTTIYENIKGRVRALLS